jgi:3-oxoadipate enol-lactonase
VRFEFDGLSFYFQEHGDGEPVLLVHGFPLSGELWRPVVERLGDGYRLIIPDLRGHGRSEASVTASMGRFAEDLAALLDHLGEQRPTVVVGLSMGGYVAFEFVRRHPERVRALVLANSRAAADSEEQARGRYESAERTRREGSRAVADSMLGKLFAPRASADLRSRWYAIMAESPSTGLAAALLAMASRPASIETLRGFERPVLVIAGENDAIASLADAEEMLRAAPDSRLEIVEDAGHMTPVEQPERFTTLLRSFLEALPPLDTQGSSGVRY